MDFWALPLLQHPEGVTSRSCRLRETREFAQGLTAKKWRGTIQTLACLHQTWTPSCPPCHILISRKEAEVSGACAELGESLAFGFRQAAVPSSALPCRSHWMNSTWRPTSSVGRGRLRGNAAVSTAAVNPSTSSLLQERDAHVTAAEASTITPGSRWAARSP